MAGHIYFISPTFYFKTLVLIVGISVFLSYYSTSMNDQHNHHDGKNFEPHIKAKLYHSRLNEFLQHCKFCATFDWNLYFFPKKRNWLNLPELFNLSVDCPSIEFPSAWTLNRISICVCTVWKIISQSRKTQKT